MPQRDVRCAPGTRWSQAGVTPPTQPLWTSQRAISIVCVESRLEEFWSAGGETREEDEEKSILTLLSYLIRRWLV